MYNIYFYAKTRSIWPGTFSISNGTMIFNTSIDVRNQNQITKKSRDSIFIELMNKWLEALTIARPNDYY